MRVDARTMPDGGLNWRVYDHKAQAFLKDVVWADDELNQLGILDISTLLRLRERLPKNHYPLIVEQRERVMIIAALKWIAVDAPADEEDEDYEEALYKSWQQSTMRPVHGGYPG